MNSHSRLKQAPPDEVEAGGTTQGGDHVPRDGGWYARMGTRGRRALWGVFILWAAAGIFLLIDRGVLPIGDGRPEPGEAAAEAVLVVAQGGPEALPALFLLVHGAEGSSLVLLPAATVVEVPGEGSPRTLAAALAESGPDGYATAVANVLGIRVPHVLIGDPEQVVDLVERLGGIDVDVPSTVEVEEDGRLRTVYVAGPRSMRGAEFRHFMTASIADQQEFDRVARQGAGWQGVFEALGTSDTDDFFSAWWSDGDAEDLSEVVSAASRNPELVIRTLPVRRVGVAGTDLYEVDRDELHSLGSIVAQVGTVTERMGRRVRLLLGAEGAMGPAVARQLIESGYVIVLTGPALEPYDQTRIVIAENTPELREVAADLRDVVGMGRMGVYRPPQSVFDVTLVIGRDWAEANGFPQPEPAQPPGDGR